MFEKEPKIITSSSIRNIIERDNENISPSKQVEKQEEQTNIHIEVPIDDTKVASAPSFSPENKEIKRKSKIDAFDGSKYLWLYNKIEEAI